VLLEGFEPVGGVEVGEGHGHRGDPARSTGWSSSKARVSGGGGGGELAGEGEDSDTIAEGEKFYPMFRDCCHF
jgi:hypothetical protein